MIGWHGDEACLCSSRNIHHIPVFWINVNTRFDFDLVIVIALYLQQVLESCEKVLALHLSDRTELRVTSSIQGTFALRTC